MKHVILVSDLRGEDIRPPVLFSKFRQLSIQDAQEFLSDPAKMVDVPCPACGSEAKDPSFKKNGFLFNACVRCKSVFVSPRPDQAALDNYYQNSRASRFRAEHYTKQTGEARRQLVLRSHASWMGRLFDEVGKTEARAYADLGTNYPLMFDEIKNLGLFDEFYSLDPIPGLDRACEERGVKVSHNGVSNLAAVTAFEQLEHEFSPRGLLTAAWDMLTPGGMLFLTTRTISGFDLQVLWDKAPYIYVPEHLNLISIEGMTGLLNEIGFEVIEFSTPGQLDLELVKLTMDDDPSLKLPSFISYLIKHHDAEAHQDFQEFLQKHRMSSHLRVAAVKKSKE